MSYYFKYVKYKTKYLTLKGEGCDVILKDAPPPPVFIPKSNIKVKPKANDSEITLSTDVNKKFDTIGLGEGSIDFKIIGDVPELCGANICLMMMYHTYQYMNGNRKEILWDKTSTYEKNTLIGLKEDTVEAIKTTLEPKLKSITHMECTESAIVDNHTFNVYTSNKNKIWPGIMGDFFYWSSRSVRSLFWNSYYVNTSGSLDTKPHIANDNVGVTIFMEHINKTSRLLDLITINGNKITTKNENMEYEGPTYVIMFSLEQVKNHLLTDYPLFSFFPSDLNVGSKTYELSSVVMTTTTFNVVDKGFQWFYRLPKSGTKWLRIQNGYVYSFSDRASLELYEKDEIYPLFAVYVHHPDGNPYT